jgi:large subunit ribosomal protein L5
MTLMYAHKVPGTIKEVKAPRLREWDDSSPYHKGRPKRGPRGGDVLRLREADINWQNIPRIEEVTIHTMVKGALKDSAHLHVAGMVLQSLSGVKPQVHKTKHGVMQWDLRKHVAASLTCTLRGDDALAFVDKCINLVFPKIKDWPGVKGTSGDSSGNIAWGFSREGTILFPEVEINYDVS